jgi:aerobic carbon-monoxide dehydrogenase large subunit
LSAKARRGCAHGGALAAITNALVDALKPLGVRHLDMPATSEKLWRLIRQHPTPLAAE